MKMQRQLALIVALLIAAGVLAGDWASRWWVNSASLHAARGKLRVTEVLALWSSGKFKSADRGRVISEPRFTDAELKAALRYSARACSVDSGRLAHTRFKYWASVLTADPRAAEAVAALSGYEHVRPWDAIAVALLLLEKGNRPKAIELLQRYECGEGLAVLGELALRRDDANQARDLLELALTVQPDSPRTMYLLGHTLVIYDSRLPAARRAVDLFRRVRLLEPSNVAARVGLAHGLVQIGCYEEALTHLSALRREEPGRATVHLLLGEVLLNLGDLDEAIIAYKACLLLEPKQVWAHYGLGQVYLKQSRLDDAFREFKLATELNRDFEPAVRELERLESRPPHLK